MADQVGGAPVGLADELVALGRALDVPEAPDLRAAVRARLAERPAPTSDVAGRAVLPRQWGWRMRAAAALAVLALLAGGTLAVSPRARAAVADFFGFGPVRVHSGAPPVPPATSAPRFGGLLPSTREATLAEARRSAVLRVVVPAALGPPDQVLVDDTERPEFVALRYGGAAGRPPTDRFGMAIELDEFAGTLRPYIEKYLGDVTVERLTIDGLPALWIDGPHEVIYADRNGQAQSASARMAARTLLWQRDGVTLRLEGELSRDQALAIARSLR